MLQLTCDRCDRTFDVEPDTTGEKVACPFCGDINRVPVGSASGTSERSGGTAPARSAAGPVPGGETVIMVVRQAMFRAHPFWYLLMVLTGVGGVILAVLGGLSVVGMPMAVVGLGLAAAAVLWWVIWWAAPRRWVKLTVTDRRTIKQEGIVMRRTSEALHSHLTNVVIEQGPLQRLLDVGYIGLDTAGMGGESARDGSRSGVEIEVHNIPHPFVVKEAIDRYRAR